jgi:hypothetical protein
MTYSRCWGSKDVKLYFTTESREKQREIFEKTHLPIQKIAVHFSKDLPYDKKFITEDELKNLVINSVPEDKNRIFLIVGETGCGKSELCQWLEYNINDGIHIPIHISRSDTKIQEIARILKSHLPETQDINVTSEIVNLRSDLLADYLAAELRLETSRAKSIKDPWDKKDLEGLFKDPTFKDKLTRDIQSYQQGLEETNKERGLMVLTKKSFEFFPIVKQLKDKESAYFFTHRTITRALKEKLNVGNIGRQLQQIAEHYVKINKRPVLLLEDLTSFTFLAEDLMDYLFDLSKGHFDVVIGWTTGFEKGHKDFIFKSPDTLTYMKERFRGRFLFTNEQDKSTFFLEDSYKELAKKYLLAVKCGKCSRCIEDKDGFYPFNTASLDKIYANLQEEGHSKQTPRLFLEFVIRKVLQSHPEPPWKVLSSTSMYVKNVPSLIGQKYREFTDFVELVKWYGNDKEGNVEIDSRVIKWFNIKSPIPIDEDVVTIPMSSIGILVQKSKIKPKKEGKEETITETKITDFQSWLNGDSDKFLTRDELRKSINDQIQLVQDPCELRNPKSTFTHTTSVFYQRGSLSTPIFIEDSGDDSLEKDYKLIVSREDPPEILEQLYLAGQNGRISSNLIIRVLDWVELKSEEYNNQLRDKLSDVIGMKLEEFVLFSQFLLINLLGKAKKPEIEHIKNIGEINFHTTNLMDSKLEVRGQKLLEKRNEIQNLFSSFFYITKSFFDFFEFEEIASNIDLNRTLKQIINIDLSKIPYAYKIGNKKDFSLFRDFVEVIKNYAYVLEQLDFYSKFTKLKEELRKVLDLLPTEETLMELPNKIDNIKKACSSLQIALQESWIKSFEKIERRELEFQDLNKKISNILNEFAECKNVFQFVQFVNKYNNCISTEEWNVISDLASIAGLVKVKSGTIEGDENPPVTNDVQRVKKTYEKLQEYITKFV